MKNKSKKKLELNKKTIARLEERELQKVKGGGHIYVDDTQLPYSNG